MSRLERDVVVAALRAEDVAAHLGITGQWRGRWMRSARCGETDHGSDAFGLARDGMWHCWSCDKGGDLLTLLALGERLDVRTDFSKVLAIAATIAGVDDDESFGGPVKILPARRPPPPQIAPLHQRIALARRRGAWLWDQLYTEGTMASMYLKGRGLDPDLVLTREPARMTPMRMTRPPVDASEDLRTLWGSMRAMGVAVPVRAVSDGAIVDVRVRRIEPEAGRPKIVGMLGSVTTAPAEPGRARSLVGCYGRPHAIDTEIAVVCEGLMDYLSALQVWPYAQAFASVEAGSLPLVVAHVAAELARIGDHTKLIIVEQNDPERTLKDGSKVAGAADQSVNEGPNAASKVAIRHLGPRRVGWLFCGTDPKMKDLNDLVIRFGAPAVAAMVTWWTDIEEWTGGAG